MRVYVTILLLVFNVPVTLAQSKTKDTSSKYFTKDGKQYCMLYIRHNLGDTLNLMSLHPAYILQAVERSKCKSAAFSFLEILTTELLPGKAAKQPAASQPARHDPFITIHGNILYNVYYHSAIDTPYAAKNVYQHTIQSYLDVSIKNQYPFRVYLNSNFSNSGLFKNFTNLNFQFNNNSFYNGIKDRLKSWNTDKLDYSELDKLKQGLDAKRNQLNMLRSWLNDGDVLQKLVEAREALFLSKLKKKPAPANYIDTLKQARVIDYKHFKVPDLGEQKGLLMLDRLFGKGKKKDTTAVSDSSSHINYQLDYDAKRKRYDSLNRVVAKEEYVYQQKKLRMQKMVDSLNQLIASIHDKNSLKEKIASSQIPDSLLPGGYKQLLAVKSFGIGSTPVNYSQLTIQNINITGVQLEYNPSYYFAFASGAVTYRFRDYLLNNAGQPKQYVTAVRYGRGKPDGNNIIFTYYTGKKYLYQYNSTVNGATLSPNFNLMGMSLQSRYQVDKNTYLTAEIAKSSLPYYASTTQNNHIFTSTFKFRDRSNEAYSITANSFISQTQTNISANYRRIGNNFQSFSLFTTSTVQTAWYIKLHQPFFKRKLLIDAALRKNDFTNPYVNETYSSTAVFKSIQATLRLKKFPVISLGYFPSSQLIKVSDNYFREDLFYTLVGNASYAYLYKRAMMNTSLTYMQFYNKQPDSGFIYFNTKNIQLNHSIYLKQFTVQWSVSDASNNYYNLYAIGGNLQYKMRSWLRVGGGVKYNRQDIMNNALVGYSLNMQVKINKVGQFDVLYDNGFIPGVNRDLVPNEVGRITYYKIF